MKLVRRIPVNNGDFRAIYSDNGVYWCYLENAEGVRDKDDFWHYSIDGDGLASLYNEYYNKLIPKDFWSYSDVVREPLLNASDGDVIMLLNWYRYGVGLD